MFKSHTRFTASLFCACLLGAFNCQARDNGLDIQFSLPALDVSPYHRPYVAVWLETPERQYLSTVSLWADDKEWYKDLRQWWRRAGRSKQDYDGVTGATRKPDTYTITLTADALAKLSGGRDALLLNIEVVREEGGRDFVRIPIALPTAAIAIPDHNEITNIRISALKKGH